MGEFESPPNHQDSSKQEKEAVGMDSAKRHPSVRKGNKVKHKNLSHNSEMPRQNVSEKKEGEIFGDMSPKVGLERRKRNSEIGIPRGIWSSSDRLTKSETDKKTKEGCCSTASRTLPHPLLTYQPLQIHLILLQHLLL